MFVDAIISHMVRGKKNALFVLGIVAIAGIVIILVLRLENTIVVENEPTYEVVPDTTLVSPSEKLQEQEVLPPPNPKLKILDTGVGYLNVRSGPSLSYERVDKVRPGGEYEYTEKESNWYHILLPKAKDGWVYGEYVREL